MNIIYTILIGTALSMDAFGVTLTNGMVYKNETFLKKLAMPLSFGIFQALMPLIGFYVGALFIDYISDYTKYFLFAIFLLLGIKMLYDGIKEIKNPKETVIHKKLLYKVIILQAVATSIDALAVGVGFSAEKNFNIFTAIFIIGLITFAICLAALFIGINIFFLYSEGEKSVQLSFQVLIRSGYARISINRHPIISSS